MSKVRLSDLLKACRAGDINNITRMVSEAPGLVDEAEASHGWTPLYRAVTGGHESAVYFLLSKGADPNRLTKMGESALHQEANSDIAFSIF